MPPESRDVVSVRLADVVSVRQADVVSVRLADDWQRLLPSLPWTRIPKVEL